MAFEHKKIKMTETNRRDTRRDTRREKQGRGDIDYFLALGYDDEKGCDVRVLVRDEGYAKYVQPAHVCGVPKKEGISVLPVVELPDDWLLKWQAIADDESVFTEHEAWLRIK